MVTKKMICSIPLFKNVASETIHKFTELGNIKHYQKNKIVLSESNNIKKFIYIFSGWAKLITTSKQGTNMTLELLTKNYYFGELFLFDEHSNIETYTIKSLSNLSVFVIPLAILKTQFKKDPQLALNLLYYSTYHQKQLMSDLKHSAIFNAEQRLACLLLKASKNNGKSNISIELPCEKTVLAERLGIRPETLSRALKKLCCHCDMLIDNDTIIIKDIKHLINHVADYCDECVFQYKL